MKSHLRSALAALVAVAMSAGMAVASPSDMLVIKKDWPTVSSDLVIVDFKFAAPTSVAGLQASDATTEAKPFVALQRAEQYALRLIERQRPVVTPEWRECPSV